MYIWDKYETTEQSTMVTVIQLIITCIMATHHIPNHVTEIISHVPLMSSEQCTISCTDTATWCARAANVCLASWEGFWTTWKMAAKQGG